MIETEVRTNISMLESVLLKLNNQIKSLEALIEQKEVWDMVEERRVDELAEEGTMEASIGVERKLVTVLRGAEQERAQLNGKEKMVEGELSDLFMSFLVQFTTWLSCFYSNYCVLYHIAALLLQRAELTGSESLTAVLTASSVSNTFGGNYDKNLSYGVKYDPEKEFTTDNSRFLQKIDAKHLSAVVRAKGAEWKTGDDLDISPEELERKAKVIKRQRLVYSGLS